MIASSFVLGFRPILSFLWLTEKVPNDVNFTEFPSIKSKIISSKNWSTISDASVFEIPTSL